MSTSPLRLLSSPVAATNKSAAQDKNEAGLKQAFTEFVAGTFYQTMMKSLRKLHDKPAYMHGGQAEEFFQAQMDQTVAADLAERHGSQFAEPLWGAFQRR